MRFNRKIKITAVSIMLCLAFTSMPGLALAAETPDSETSVSETAVSEIPMVESEEDAESDEGEESLDDTLSLEEEAT